MNKKLLVFIVLVIVVVVVGFVAILSWHAKPTKPPAQIIAIKVFPTPLPGWKRYIDTQDEYSIAVPASFSAEITDNKNQYSKGIYRVDKYLFELEEDRKKGIFPTVLMSITVPYRINGKFEDLAKRKNIGDAWLLEPPIITNTTFDGHHALITKFVLKPPSLVTPPPGFRGGNVSAEFAAEKNAYIDLQNGKVLEIDASWNASRQDFEHTFDQILSTISFTVPIPH
ncbi:MAG TPA: hypothetical protein VEP90_02575 [Methylomirabilota bacterium]|nr:hypothetical protein [Methylomirabilota bacterium]